MTPFLTKHVHHFARIAQSSGGSSGGNSTTTQELPGYLQPMSQQIASTGQSLSQQAVPQYGGQIYKGMNSQQTGAVQGMQNLANSGGVGGSVGGSITGMANNGGNNYGNISSPTASAVMNPYASMSNPYMQQEMQSADQQTTNAFNANAMSTNAQFAGSGAYGGSAYQNAVNNNNSSLGASLANINSQIGNNAYNTGAQAASVNSQMGTQANLANASNYLGAQQLNSNNWNTAQGRVLAAGQVAPGLDSDTLNQLNAAYTGGTALQTNGQNQLNANYQQWEQGAMSPYEQLGIEESALAGANGGGAQGITSSTQNANPFGAIAGLGVSGMGLLGSLAQSGSFA